MTPEQLAAIGRARFPDAESWVGPLADRLAIDDRTMQRYANGVRPIPESLAQELTELLNQQVEAVNDALVLLRRKPVKR